MNDRLQPVEPISIALIDDHVLMRQGVTMLLEVTGEFKVVHVAGNGREFIDTMALAPPVQIALVDLRMPVMDGFETMTWLRIHRPDIRRIALSLFDDKATVRRALLSGAEGYVTKSMRDAELCAAVKDVLRNCFDWNELLRKCRPVDEEGDRKMEPVRAPRSFWLTEREHAFLVLACGSGDLTYAQIAERMQVSIHTVVGYRRELGLRFNLRSRGALIRFGLVHGLVPDAVGSRWPDEQSGSNEIPKVQ